MKPATVSIRLLGAPSLLYSDGTERSLAPIDAALLAVLALDGPQERETLANLLWPDGHADGGRANLRQRLFRLRREGSDIVQMERQRVSLAEGVLHDLAGINARLRADPQASVGELLGGADPLSNPSFGVWLRRARDRLRAQRRELLSALAEDLEQRRQIAVALPYASRLADDEPLLEHAQRRLMRLHYMRADRSAALAVYARLVDNLHRELGASPDVETIELRRLIQQEPTRELRTAPVPRLTSAQLASVLRPPRLVQREVEWAELEEAFEGGRSVLVAGEAGIGKSRLLDEFAKHHGVRVSVAARAGDGGVPYAVAARLLHALPLSDFGGFDTLAPWVTAELARLDPSLGQPPAAPLLPLRLIQAFLCLLNALPPDLGSMVIDDLHFADAATLELLPALGAPPRRLLMGVRSTQRPAALVEWLHGSGSEICQIDLQPLDGTGVRALIEALALPQFNAALWGAPLTRHTGGHPLMVLETIRALVRQGYGAEPPAVLPLPSEVRRLIQSRLEQLSEGALRLAQVAALAAPDFSAPVAMEVLVIDELALAAPWRELREAAIMASDSFVHDIVLECARASVPSPLAQALRGRIASALSRRGASAARVADHWAAAGEHEHAAESYEAAALTAQAASRRGDERVHRAAAIACWEFAGDPERAFAARVQLVRSLNDTGQADEGLALGDALAVAARTDRERAWAACVRSQSCAVLSRWPDALLAAVDALASAKEQDDDALRCDASTYAAAALAQLGRPEEALARLADAEACIARLGDRQRGLAVVLMQAHVVDRLGRYEAARALLVRAIPLAEGVGEMGELMTTHNSLASVYGRLARVPDALTHARIAQRLGLRLEQLDGIQGMVVEMHVGMFEGLSGELGPSVLTLEKVLGPLSRLSNPDYAAHATHHLGWNWMMLGQPARARRLIWQPMDGLSTMLRVRRLTLRGRFARLCGDDAAPDDWQAEMNIDETVEMPVGLSARLELARRLPPEEAWREARSIARAAESASLRSAWMNARLLAVQSQSKFDSSAAVEPARHLWTDLRAAHPTDAYWPEFAWGVSGALSAAGLQGEAWEALRAANDWITRVAAAHVPPSFRDGFLDRNLINRSVRQAMRAHLSQVDELL